MSIALIVAFGVFGFFTELNESLEIKRGFSNVEQCVEHAISLKDSKTPFQLKTKDNVYTVTFFVPINNTGFSLSPAKDKNGKEVGLAMRFQCVQTETKKG